MSNLTYLKKQAKKLHRAALAGEETALERFRQHFPRWQDKSGDHTDLVLADAQLVIAREQGFSTWADLKRHSQQQLLDAFRQLVMAGDAETVDTMLQNNDYLREHIDDPIFDFGGTALICARYNREMVDVLLKHGADINARSDWEPGGFGVLHHTPPDEAAYLVERGATIDIHAAVELGMYQWVRNALENEPELIHARGGDGKSPLHFAHIPQMIDLLLESGADLEFRDLDHDSTPAEHRIEDADTLRHLIERGAKPDIFMACRLGDLELVKRLVDENPQCLTTRTPGTGLHIYIFTIGSNLSPFQVARKYRHREVYDYLLERAAVPEQFIAACERVDEATARQLLNQHPHLVAELPDHHQCLIADMAWEGKLDAVKLLLELGFDVNFRSVHDSTPLDRAAFHGFADIIQVLLEHGADLNVLNEFETTPLRTAIYGSRHGWRTDGDYVATINTLLKAGAALDAAWVNEGSPEVNAVLWAAVS
ncbi:MAG: ankyrin repeat domain-containing protein [Chloroflexi bacterium]|nr:ankyrin repeat domain-containing protein [Chloroflexota bacterium]